MLFGQDHNGNHPTLVAVVLIQLVVLLVAEHVFFAAFGAAVQYRNMNSAAAVSCDCCHLDDRFATVSIAVSCNGL